MTQVLPLFIALAMTVSITEAFSASVASSKFIASVRNTKTAKSSGLRTMEMRWGLKGPQANLPGGQLEDGVALRDTVPFELRGFSLPLVVFSIGAGLTAFSFAGFFLNEGGGEGALSSLGFVYGIPVFLIGLSLWYAEIPPVVVVSDANGDSAWDELATDTMKKIRQDVTRHRYGDDAHLDSTLESLGLKLPQKKFPKMKEIVLQKTPEGELSYMMTFQSADTPYKVWADPDRVDRYTKFFGPGVVADIVKIDAKNRIVGLKLTTTFKGGNAVVGKAEDTSVTSTSDDF